MARSRVTPALLAALALLAAPFSGCLGAEDEAATVAEDEDTIVLTSPDDYSYLENETATTPRGERWHVHDYWGGEDRLILMESETSVAWKCSGCSESSVGMTFRSPSKSVVPQGTAWVNVTFTWTSSESNHAQPVFFYHAADSKEFVKAGQVENGVTITLNSTNDMNDPPHQVLSLWVFRFVLPPADAEGTVEFDGTVKIRVEVFRGLDIPPYPPHPDFWNGSTELPLLEASGGTALQYQTEYSTNCYNGCLGWHSPDAGRIVPYDATAVLLALTYDGAVPPTLGIIYHGADTWDFAPVEGETTGTSVTYRIPVSLENADSPYAKESLWEFRVVIEQPTPVRVFSGGYSLSVKVVKE